MKTHNSFSSLKHHEAIYLQRYDINIKNIKKHQKPENFSTLSGLYIHIYEHIYEYILNNILYISLH